jgi:HD superfamily phosphodiesterase
MPTLNDPIESHADYVISAYYLIPYPNKNNTTTEEDIARFHHGAQHASAVTMLVAVFANLFRRYGYSDACKFTDEDLKLLQIAALFHDSARQGDEKDFWDKESASECYKYLVNELAIEPEKAKKYAEAIANKDLYSTITKYTHYGSYQSSCSEFHTLDLQTLQWETKKIDPTLQKFTPKSIENILLHDADCLEILRARDAFDAKYLDFYNLIAKNDPDAAEKMGCLIREHRALQHYQGNGRKRTDVKIKKRYEHAESCYAETTKDLENENLALNHLKTFYAKNKLLSHEELKKTSISRSLPLNANPEMTKKLDNGQIFLRGIFKPEKTNELQNKKNNTETHAQLEIRKLLRNTQKKGNPIRSISLVGQGSQPPRSAGFIIEVDPKRILETSAKDVDSGWSKKTGNIGKYTLKNEEENKKALDKLFEKMSLGGDNYQGYTHTEIIYNLEKEDVYAIYFSRDPNVEDIDDITSSPNPDAPLLKAIYIQAEYEKLTGKKLPIYEYSASKNIVSKECILNDNEIVNLWKNSASLPHESKNIFELDVQKFKVQMNSKEIKGNKSLDENYSPELKKKLNDALTNILEAKKTGKIKYILDALEKQTTFSKTKELCFLLKQALVTQHIPLSTLKKKHFENIECFLKQANNTEKMTLKEISELSVLVKLLSNEACETAYKEILDTFEKKYQFSDFHIHEYAAIKKLQGSPISPKELTDSLKKSFNLITADHLDTFSQLLSDVKKIDPKVAKDFIDSMDLEKLKNKLFDLMSAQMPAGNTVQIAIWSLLIEYKIDDAAFINHAVKIYIKAQDSIWAPTPGDKFSLFSELKVIDPTQTKYPQRLPCFIRYKQNWIDEILFSRKLIIADYVKIIETYKEYPFLGRVDSRILDNFKEAIKSAERENIYISSSDYARFTKLLSHTVCTSIDLVVTQTKPKTEEPITEEPIQAMLQSALLNVNGLFSARSEIKEGFHEIKEEKNEKKTLLKKQ